MNLSKPHIASRSTLKHDEELSSETLRLQIHRAALDAISQTHIDLEDAVFGLFDGEDDAPFREPEEFGTEHLFEELLGYALCLESPHTYGFYEVVTFGLEGGPEFSLTLILMPVNDDPTGYFFLGQSTEIMDVLRWSPHEDEHQAGPAPKALSYLATSLHYTESARGGDTIEVMLEQEPLGASAGVIAEAPELVEQWALGEVWLGHVRALMQAVELDAEQRVELFLAHVRDHGRRAAARPQRPERT